LEYDTSLSRATQASADLCFLSPQSHHDTLQDHRHMGLVTIASHGVSVYSPSTVVHW